MVQLGKLLVSLLGREELVYSSQREYTVQTG